MPINFIETPYKGFRTAFLFKSLPDDVLKAVANVFVEVGVVTLPGHDGLDYYVRARFWEIGFERCFGPNACGEGWVGEVQCRWLEDLEVEGRCESLRYDNCEYQRRCDVRPHFNSGAEVGANPKNGIDLICQNTWPRACNLGVLVTRKLEAYRGDLSRPVAC